MKHVVFVLYSDDDFSSLDLKPKNEKYMYIDKFKSWVTNSVGNPIRGTNFEKNLFLATNVIYYIPLITGLNLKSFQLAMVGWVSLLFHFHQCYRKNREITMNLMWVDLGFTAGSWFTLWCKVPEENIPLSWYLSWLVFSPLLALTNSRMHYRKYMVNHGMWHLVSGILINFLYFKT